MIVPIVMLFLVASPACGAIYTMEASRLEDDLHARLAEAAPGDVIVLPAGRFAFSRGLTVAVPGIRVRGQGRKKTRIDFSTQKTGGQSLLVVANDVRISGIGLINPPSDGLVARGTSGLQIEDVGVEWDDAASPDNGGYGIYPVNSSNVSVIGCYARGASEAGIYVGQTSDSVVAESRVEGNVVGLDIENSVRVRVMGNDVEGNSVGILVAARPGLFQTRSVGNVISENRVRRNNLKSFAANGSYFHRLGEGRGIVVIASSGTRIDDNLLGNHDRSDLLLLNFSSLGMDAQNDAFFVADLDDTRIGDNRFEKSSRSTAPGAAARWQDATGFEVIWDGIFSSRPTRPELRPIPFCKSGEKDLDVFNVESFGEDSMNLERAPHCSALNR